MNRTTKSLTIPAICILLAAVSTYAAAQFGRGRGGPPAPAQNAIPFDITGYWVSLVTEDWRYRIITGPVGDAPEIPMSEQGRRIAETWDPAQDEELGEACRAYGAGGIMRMPTRLNISWAGENVLSIETDAGMQTRLLKFGPAQDGAGAGTWQGISNATLVNHGGGRSGPVTGATIEVDTTDMRMGYLRRNGIPYSEQATLKEYFEHVTEDDGTEYLILLSILEDPEYLSGPVITSTNFRKEADASNFNPQPCDPY